MKQFLSYLLSLVLSRNPDGNILEDQDDLIDPILFTGNPDGILIQNFSSCRKVNSDKSGIIRILTRDLGNCCLINGGDGFTERPVYQFFFRETTHGDK